MEAAPSQIIQFFNGFKQSVIPLFQRPYEWKEGNWETLWHDVLERHQASTDASHFMGAIVTMPSKSVPVGVAKHLIIDGQQRLTTLALLLCAIRDELSADARVERSRIQNHYLTNDGYDNLDYFKVLPTQDDRQAFNSLVNPSTPPNTDTPMHKAYRFFRQRIKDGDSDGNSINVSNLLTAVERKLITVNINLGETEDPYLIFESLNAKGSPLTQADLVRNYFLMKFAIVDQERVYRELWLPMQRRLGDNLTEFMRHYLMRSGDEILKDDVYSQLKKRVQELSQADIESALGDMLRVSDYYLRLIKPMEEPDLDIQVHLTQLLKWELTTSYPVTLKLYDAYTRSDITKDEFTQCLKTIESFVVRRWVCGVPTNQLKKIFLTSAKGFTTTNTLAWLRDTLSGSAGRRWPGDDEFSHAWKYYKVYSVARRCKLILESLERSFGHKEPAVLDDASIEHVMPQTLTKEWRSMLAVDGNDPERSHALLGDTIGNLTLTAYNPELSNLNFEEKKKIYDGSHYSLNEHFPTCQIWSPKQIEERANELCERAKRIWVAPPQSKLSETESEDTIDSDNDETETGEPVDRAAKRALIINTLSERVGTNLLRKGRTTYSSADGACRAVCIISKRHNKGYAYWFGYSEAARLFLSGGDNGLLVLGCLDRNSAYAIPATVIEKLVDQLNKTPNVHWHVGLNENQDGEIEFYVPNGAPMRIGAYEFAIQPQDGH